MTRRTTAAAVLLAACLAMVGFSNYAGAADFRGSSSSATASAEEVALAAELGKNFQVQATGGFAFIFNRNQDFARASVRLLEQSQTSFYDLYKEAGFKLQASDQRHVWICFSSRADFESYAQRADRSPLSWLSEYYSARTNRVTLVREQVRSAADEPRARLASGSTDGGDFVHAADATATYGADVATVQAVSTFRLHESDVTRLTHEAAHQFSFNSGLMTRGVMYPLWVAEGLATHFEADATRLSGRGSHNISRRARLINAHRRGALVPLSQFVTVVKPPQGGSAVGDAYAQSWGLYSFLFETRTEQLQQYLKAMAAKPTSRMTETEQRREFVKAFGPMSKVQADWDAFVTGLSQAPRSTLVGSGR